MKQQLSKICADSLRTFVTENYGVKLKATHAHELTAAFFGYSTKNSMLADINYPIANLIDAEIVVMLPDDFIDQRRSKLQGLPDELPDSYTLGEAVYASFFSDDWWGSEYPPFRGFKQLAKHLIENNDAYQTAFKLALDIPAHHIVDISNAKDYVLLTVTHAHETSNNELLGFGQTTINLPRVAGRIGFGKPKIRVERWSGEFRRKLGSLEVQS